jgi:hypothetical protein
MYPADTGHNFVLADEKCNSAKSDFLASEEFCCSGREIKTLITSLQMSYQSWVF